MINSAPNNKNYHNGNYIPKNIEKVMKLNSQGGVFYRSSWEQKIMIWLDSNKSIKKWTAESIEIPYQVTEFNKGELDLKKRRYYPDFYYEIENKNGEITKVVAEVKPMSEYNDVVLLSENKFDIKKNASLKQLKSLEYRFKMANKNLAKWETIIKYCQIKGWKFIVITEQHLKKFNL